MIPQGGTLNGNSNARVVQLASRTFRLDPVSKRIVGIIDGLDAIKQTVFQILNTERYEFLIFSGNYGIEMADIPGKGQGYVQSEFGRRIRATLMCDERITDVQDIQIAVTGDEALARFTVVTQYGSFQASKEVT